MTFSRRPSALAANSRVSAIVVPKISTSSGCSSGIHFGLSTPSASGRASAIARWIASV